MVRQNIDIHSKWNHRSPTSLNGHSISRTRRGHSIPSWNHSSKPNTIWENLSAHCQEWVLLRRKLFSWSVYLLKCMCLFSCLIFFSICSFLFLAKSFHWKQTRPKRQLQRAASLKNYKEPQSDTGKEEKTATKTQKTPQKHKKTSNIQHWS